MKGYVNRANGEMYMVVKDQLISIRDDGVVLGIGLSKVPEFWESWAKINCDTLDRLDLFSDKKFAVLQKIEAAMQE